MIKIELLGNLKIQIFPFSSSTAFILQNLLPCNKFEENLKNQIKKLLGIHDYERFILHRMPFSLNRALPNFIIVGTQKGGTTSLFDQLSKHPQIANPYCKEIHYFNRSNNRSLAFYRAHFPYQKENLLYGEASPDYFDHPIVPKRMAETLSNVKLIILLRNPITRAFSHYQMMKRLGLEKLPFREALNAEEMRISSFLTNPETYDINFERYAYLHKGLYAQHLANWFKHYDKENILLLKSEDYFENPAPSYEKTLGFLGCTDDHSPANWIKMNSGGYNKSMNDNDIAYLKDYFKKPNEMLIKLAGSNFAWNS